ncbi:LacI family DNA-binding transcriptional regulator [Actinocorallia lasiicapitis]
MSSEIAGEASDREPTVADVAEQAGVSAATVAQVLKGSDTVQPELAAKVLQVARRLGYRANPAAPTRKPRLDTWALIISDIENPFFTSVISGIEEVAATAGYHFTILNSDEDIRKEEECIATALRQRSAGVIIAPVNESVTDVSPLVDEGIPVVSVDRIAARGEIDSVLLDNVSSARFGTMHLISQGFTRIALIGGPPEATTGAQRRQGYRDALQASGLPFDPALEFVGHFRQSGGHEAMLRILDLEPPVPALLIANNLMTLGALTALHERGVLPPRTPAIAAFDEFTWHSLLSPPMTIIAQPTHEIGKAAGELLVARITDPEAPVRHVLLQPELKVWPAA